MAFRTNKTPVLQEKTASGSVASFNTALAMPLASCNIAVNAWQEGSGDPSPDNVRPIHGFSEVNATRAGKNLLDFNSLVFANPSSMTTSNATPRKWVDNSYCRGISHNNYANPSGVYEYEMLTNGFNVRGSAAYGINIPLQLPPLSQITVSAESVVNGKIEVGFYREDGTWLSSSSGNYQTKKFTVPVNAKWSVLVFTCVDNSSIGQFRNILVEVGSTATDYEAYTGNIYTIQLVQEVYGAEVDIVNGVAHVTHRIDDMGDINWTYLDSTDTQFFYGKNRTVKTSPNGVVVPKILADIYKPTSTNTLRSNTDYMVSCGYSSYYAGFLLVKNPDYTDATLFKQAMANHKICYELATPFDIQLTPTQIDTIRGDNTIFADTGDIDLTYNDLDIAKRGSFREVFRLPS